MSNHNRSYHGLFSQGIKGMPLNYNDASQLENQNGDASTSFIYSSNENTSKEAPDKTRGYKRLAVPTKNITHSE